MRKRVGERSCVICLVFFFNDTATTEIYTRSLPGALPFLAALVVLYIIFGVIKPAFKSLSKPHKEVIGLEGEGAEGQAALAGGAGGGIGNEEADALPKPPDNYEMQLDTARKLVVEDPKIAAQVVKNWLAA